VLIPHTDLVQDLKILTFLHPCPVPIPFQLNLNTNTEHLTHSMSFCVIYIL